MGKDGLFGKDEEKRHPPGVRFGSLKGCSPGRPKGRNDPISCLLCEPWDRRILEKRLSAQARGRAATLWGRWKAIKPLDVTGGIVPEAPRLPKKRVQLEPSFPLPSHAQGLRLSTCSSPDLAAAEKASRAGYGLPLPPRPHPTLCLEISQKPHPGSWRKGALRGGEEGNLKERNWMKEEGQLLCSRCCDF